MNDSTVNQQDLSIIAGNIVSNALQLTRNLFCPYCGDAHMFEFTLKDHLRRAHHNILVKQQSKANKIIDGTDDSLLLSPESQQLDSMHSCPFCGARFVNFGLIPKHISNYHGNDLLQIWQQQEGNLEKLKFVQNIEPSIVYAACSPGLSDIFDKINTDDDCDENNTLLVQDNNNRDVDRVELKSILKKTPNKANKIIFSPSSGAIRRAKSQEVKRSVSVRRELRFDPDTKKSPPASQSLSPKLLPSTCSYKISKLFCRRPSQLIASNKKVSNKIITSTPINFLDDVDGDDDFRVNKKNWKATIRQRNVPLFFGAERYQCARCKKCYENNADLLVHISENHKGVKHWLRPPYRCSLCGSKFYSNSYLVRHCHLQHTPVKMTKRIARF